MTTLAPMFFYAGLTSGRGLAPLVLLSLSEGPLVIGALSLVAIGTTVVIFSAALKVVIAGVFLAGLGCASIYPLYIAWLSKWYGARANRVGGWFFARPSLGACPEPRVGGRVS